MNGVRAQLRVLLGFGQGEQFLGLSADHESVQNRALRLRVGAGSINVGQSLAAFLATKQRQVIERLSLQVRIGMTARNVRQDLPRASRAALRQDKERFLLQLSRLTAALESFFQQRKSPVRIGVYQAV